MKKCAICFVDPNTKRRGTNSTTWICHDCRNEKIDGKRVNKGWGIHPTEENHLDDADAVPSTVETPKPDSKPGKYETETAVLVMKLYCMDVGTQSVIAKMTGCTQPYVCAVIKHWKKEYPVIVAKLREFFIDKTMIS